MPKYIGLLSYAGVFCQLSRVQIQILLGMEVELAMFVWAHLGSGTLPKGGGLL